MIAIALLMLAQASGQTPPLEDYLPGGPERVQVEALQWLEKAEAQLARHDAFRVTLQQTLQGETFESSYWIRRGIGIQGIPFDDESKPRLPSTPGLFFQDSLWERPMASCLPLLTWFDADAPDFSELKLERRHSEGVAVRVHWVRDGLRGTLEWADSGTPRAWTWQGDGRWGRAVDSLEVQVLEWLPATQLELPEPIRSATPPTPSQRYPAQPASSSTSSLPAEWSANEAWNSILEPFGSSRSFHAQGTITLQLSGAEEGPIQVGQLTFSMDLHWPALGKIELKGELGLPGETEVVDVLILGDESRYWHWDRVRNQVKPVPGLTDLLAGFQGLLPLYAWAAQAVPEADLSATWMEADAGSSHREERWLRVSDGPTTTEFLLGHGPEIREARVIALNAREGAPELIYEFDQLHFRPPSVGGVAALPARGYVMSCIGSWDELNSARDQEASSQALDEAESLMKVGTSAPLDQAWQREEQQESLRILLGKPTVLVFWYRDAVSCLPALTSVARLAYRLNGTQFRAIAIDEREERAAAFLKDNRINLPLGIAEGTELQRAFRARWLPTTYLIGADGVVLGAWLGDPGEELVQALEKLPR